MNVLSLFNGMNTGRQALENVGIKVDKYFSSEIKPYAIELTQYHFPDTIQVGDVTKWRDWDIDWKTIDLVLSGSPCQDLSAAGKRAGINGKKSSLFFVFVEILEHIKSLNPNVLFLQENVGSASKLDVGIMSRALGVYPVRINSSLVTAQLRNRYYWSNIKTRQDGMFGDIVTDIPQPKDKEIFLKDILTFNKKYVKQINSDLIYYKNNEIRIKANNLTGYDIINDYDCINLAFEVSKTRRGRVNSLKSPCLLKSNEPLYYFYNGLFYRLNKIELCRLQGFPDNYCDIISENKSASLLGDGWTLPIIEHIFKFIQK